MRCSRAQRLISQELDGDLSEPARRKLAQHLSRCEECEVVSHDLRAIRNGLGQLHHPEPSKAGFPEVFRALEGPPPRWSAARARWRFPVAIMAGTAPAIVLVASVIFALWVVVNRGDTPSVEPTRVVERRAVAKQALEPTTLLAAAVHEFRQAEVHYLRAVAHLRRLAAKRTREWGVGERRTFWKQLRLVDTAVGRCREAAALAPENPRLQEELFSAYRRQLSYLRGALLARGVGEGQGGT